MPRGICKLCLKDADLRRSHYLGKALYRLNSTDGDLPIFASTKLVIQDQKQIADYVLCSPCEQLFSKHGEDYVFRMVNRKNEFKMMELVRAHWFRRVNAGEFTVYPGSEMGIDTNALAYFAVSVIWRGGVHIWRTFNNCATGGLELGQHGERMRRYLLGEILSRRVSS